MITWPDSLQQNVNADSFTFTPGETVLRSDVDVGPAKVRRRTTRSVDTMQATINLPLNLFSVLDQFYRTDVNGGASAFQFVHPISRLPVTVRFTKAPVYTPLGGIEFQAALELEILP